MTTPTKQKITHLPPDAIQVEERLRGVSAAAVDTLVCSIRELGLLHPLQVQKIKGGYRLLDGMHRLTAARKLGLSEVPVSVFTCSNHQAMKIEVEGNLAGAPLNPLDMGLFLAAQKRLYEEEHPETRNGAKGLNAINGVQTDKMSIWSFAANAADVLGKNERSIRRLIKAATDLAPDEIAMLRRAERRVQLNDLEFLGKLGDAGDRRAICEALSQGTAKNARAALRAQGVQPGAAVKTKADQDSGKLAETWARASKAARRQFVRDHAVPLRELLDQLDAPGGEIVSFESRRS
ncbi:hypothetical protein BOO69_09515 [Sulfitobacter alexandrii]|uniref:ParB-like N-terminal domain-containing protein n=1 Tax=Sulfitobacter alexandrii TaxID=1917485 RepID=A0A1J0WHH6_9RHOB|nr:ParB/RepB/Spo0J family partition protein [Sulfitobacter alexandrii]APE43624.1 hypothetical protein BOO69_09515 [Sulfitobacter alexandrii]